MKVYVADTLIGIFALDETGNILNFIDFDGEDEKIIEFYKDVEKETVQDVYRKFLSELKTTGYNEFIFDNVKLETLTRQKLEYITRFKKLIIELKEFRLNLESHLKEIGISMTSEEILIKYKKISEELTKIQISEVSGHVDNIIIQVITILDMIKKSISLFSSHLREWYGLHFPELTDKIVEDNILLSRLISILGARSNFTYDNIKYSFDINDKKINELEQFALDSMGADIDLNLLQNYADQIISLEAYGQKLENYLVELMEKTAPNINALIGSLIGAKLISKAGSLQKLAYMPASRIQLLGAEKALYRFLKTGEKRPKHGIIFQWNQIRSAVPWLRGKIARVVAGKVGLSAKVDYFSGEFIGDKLSIDINQKIKDLEKKYPTPPKRVEAVKTIKNKRKKKKYN